MGRFELNVNLDQIKKLKAQKKYKEAAMIANSLDIRKVKDWPSLRTIIIVQQAAGFIEEARDTAIVAYNRNQGGKELVYMLGMLFIRLRQYGDAEELCNEYAHMAPRDSKRLLLEYELRKSQNAQVELLIEILEEYRDETEDVRYMYELAQLYNYAKMEDKCIRICSDIILYFSDSEYCAPAVELKQKYSVITPIQQKLFEDAKKRESLSGNDSETKEILFEKAKSELLTKDEMEEELISEEKTINIDSEKVNDYVDKSSKVQDYEEDEDEEDEDVEDDDDLAMDLIQNKSDSKAKNFFKALIKHSMNEEKRQAELKAQQEAKEQAEALEAEKKMDTEAGIKDAQQSLDEMIENAHRNVEETVEQVHEEDREEQFEKTAKEIEIPIKHENPYDTVNLAKELAPNISAILDEENALSGRSTKGDTAPVLVVPNPSPKQIEVENTEPVDENAQIEGQMTIGEWFAAVQEKKFGNQVTREYSKAELDRELAARESKEEAYDRLMEKQREVAHKLGMPFDENEARKIAKEQVIYQSAKQDLAIRTGKAAARLEVDFEKQKEDDKIWLFAYKSRMAEEMRAAASKPVKEEPVKEEPVKEEPAKEEPVKQEPVKEQAEEVVTKASDNVVSDSETFDNESSDNETSDNEASDNETSDNEIPEYEDSEEEYEDSDSEEEYEEYDEDEDEEDDEEEEDDEDEKPVKEKKRFFLFGRKKKDEPEDDDEDEEYEDDEDDEDSDSDEEYEEYDEEEEEDDEDEYEEPAVDVPKSVRKYFTKYYDMDGVIEQLAVYFDEIENEIRSTNSRKGNIIISGNKSADKAKLANSIARAINQLYPECPRKVVKTSGDSMNIRGIATAISRLKGTMLLVEDAGVINPKRIAEMISVLDQDTGGMIVVLLGSDSEMNVLLSVNPELARHFNHRIVIKQYSVAELVDYARKYAGKRQHVVNDDALTLLYMKINELSKDKEFVSTDEVKEVIDTAIVKAERRAARKLFKRRARRGGEFFILTEADFND